MSLRAQAPACRQAGSNLLEWCKDVKNCFVALLLAMTVFFPLATAFAEIQLPPVPNTYVSDFAHVLNADQRFQLEMQLSQIEKTGSNQVLVVTIPDLQDVPIEDYGIRLAEKWKPGQKDRNNGVILLVAPKDRKVRIEVGYGLEGVLTDALTKNIIETKIKPEFRQGDFFSGIQIGIQAIAQAIAGEYQPLPTGGSPVGTSFIPLLIFFFIFFVILLPWIIKVNSYGIARGGWGRGTGGWSSGGSSGGSWGGGGWSSGSSGGGFSSGGGSFGGGGSSGSW